MPRMPHDLAVVIRTGFEVNALEVDFRITQEVSQPPIVVGTRVFRHCPTKRLYVFETEPLVQVLNQGIVVRDWLAGALLAGLALPMRRSYRNVHFFHRDRPLDESHGEKGKDLNERIPTLEQRYTPTRRISVPGRQNFAFAVR